MKHGEAVGKVLASALAALAIGCGARTGLPEPRLDGSVDGSDHDADAPEADAPFLRDAASPTCAVRSAEAELSRLDVFMLFDASGSMQEVTSSGITKWRAVRRAIRRFFDEPESRGIGIGLTFFPIVREDVPTLCEEDAACGSTPDQCVPTKVCAQAGVVCNTDENCAIAGFPNDSCISFGYCPDAGMDAFCAGSLFPCPSGGPCAPLGLCENRNTCEPEAYESPIVPVSLLPDAAPRLIAAYDAEERPREHAGGTPTLPALRGALRGATAWSRLSPTHRVVAVLATDGVPASCDPDLRVSLDLGVANVADAAREGLEGGIQTFVIGVFGPTERSFAQANLNRIAESGGTARAFIANTEAAVSDEFLEALNQVRLDASACDFALTEPVPLTGEPVWVRIARGPNDEFWAPQVSGEEECGGGGFYFPAPPAPTAHRIILCPSTCTLLGASPNRRIELYTRCEGDPRP